MTFSREVETGIRSVPWYFRPAAMLAPVAVLVVVAVGLTVYHFRETPDTRRGNDAVEAQQTIELKRENSALPRASQG